MNLAETLAKHMLNGIAVTIASETYKSLVKEYLFQMSEKYVAFYHYETYNDEYYSFLGTSDSKEELENMYKRIEGDRAYEEDSECFILTKTEFFSNDKYFDYLTNV